LVETIDPIKPRATQSPAMMPGVALARPDAA
jgi:hypothetical protein